jgi:hypothetical protein
MANCTRPPNPQTRILNTQRKPNWVEIERRPRCFICAEAQNTTPIAIATARTSQLLARPPEPPRRLAKAVKSIWLEMRQHGSVWLTSADRFLVEFAAIYMARYRNSELRSAEIALLIGVLNKIGFSPAERKKLNLPTQTA